MLSILIDINKMEQVRSQLTAFKTVTFKQNEIRKYILKTVYITFQMGI